MSTYSDEVVELERAYTVAQQVPDNAALQRVMDVLRDRTLYAVGSGGALAAAELAAFAHARRTDRPSSAMTPLAFIESGVVALDAAMIVFSSRAKHPDTALAVTHARDHGLPVVLVTQLQREDLAEALREDSGVRVLSIDADFRDGFLATRTTVAMATLIARIYGDPLLEFPAPKPLGVSSLRDRILVLYSAAARSAAVDIETRFHELGLRDVQIADYRNFAHGRHVGLNRRIESTTVIALADARTRSLARKTLDVLPVEADVCLIEASGNGIAAAVELLIAVMGLPLLALDSMKTDPAKPRVPSWGRRLYHLSYRRDFQAVELSPVQQKAVAGGFGPHVSDALAFYAEAFGAWKRRIARLPVDCIVLDYDGTCVSTEGRYDLPDCEVQSALTRTLDLGIQLIFSTGRGDSLYRDLRAWVPEAFWGQIRLELHQGAWPQALTAPLVAPDKTEPWISGAVERLAAFDKSGLITLRSCGYQLSVRPANTRQGVGALHRLVMSVLADLPDVVVSRSGHSVDVIDIHAGKRRTADSAAQRHGGVLAIGDQGSPGGNDFELLDRGPLTVSVDECSGAPDRCWRLTGARTSGPPALVDVLSRLSMRAGQMYLRV